jgi:hypothetical protein
MDEENGALSTRFLVEIAIGAVLSTVLIGDDCDCDVPLLSWINNNNNNNNNKIFLF